MQYACALYIFEKLILYCSKNFGVAVYLTVIFIKLNLTLKKNLQRNNAFKMNYMSQVRTDIDFMKIKLLKNKKFTTDGR